VFIYPERNAAKQQKRGMSDSKSYHGVHAHMIGTGETAAQQWCVLSIEKQHVEGREKDCQQLLVVVFWLPPPAVM
jgi:hypothetical protein